MATHKKDVKRTPRRFLIPVTITVVAITAIFSFYYIYNARKMANTVSSSSVNTGKNKLESIPGGHGSPEYTRNLKEYDKEQAKEAYKNGQSRISTVIGASEAKLLIDDAVAEPQLPKKIEPKQRVAQKTPSKKSTREDKQISQKKDQEYLKKLLALTESLRSGATGELQLINEKIALARPEQSIEVFEVDIEKLKASSTPQPLDSRNSKKVKYTPFEVGEMIYAANTIFVNSDVPGPVVAEILSGPLKGGVFTGEFTRYEGQIVLKFRKFAFNKEVIKVEAYAVNPATTGYALRSSVNYHRFSRWAGLIGASFLEGFSGAVEASGVSEYVTNDSYVKNTPEYSIEDQMWIAAGTVGERLSVPMYQNFYTPPTVKLNAGEGIGVLIVSN